MQPNPVGILIFDGAPVIGTLPLGRSDFADGEVILAITSHISEIAPPSSKKLQDWHHQMGFRTNQLEPRRQAYYYEFRGQSYRGEPAPHYYSHGVLDLADGDSSKVEKVDGKELVRVGTSWNIPPDGWLIGPVFDAYDRFAGQQAIWATGIRWVHKLYDGCRLNNHAEFRLEQKRTFVGAEALEPLVNG
jgi:hypothetical protein